MKTPQESSWDYASEQVIPQLPEKRLYFTRSFLLTAANLGAAPHGTGDRVAKHPCAAQPLRRQPPQLTPGSPHNTPGNAAPARSRRKATRPSHVGQ